MRDWNSILIFGLALGASPVLADWTIDSEVDWKTGIQSSEGLAIQDGMVFPVGKSAMLTTRLRQFEASRSPAALTIEQSPDWLNWHPVGNVGPSNLLDAPVLLVLGPQDYWMFGRFGKEKSTIEPGGYHAWQSRDMKIWIHYGPVTDAVSRWVTSAEAVDGRVLIYYDFPNDQDPHLVVDDDLFDGEPGAYMGMVLKDPTHGSDAGFIRDLDGRVHAIFEDWSPIDASRHSWDSPLAGHAVSPDGIEPFQIRGLAVDHRTQPTGAVGTFRHPHWMRDDPENYPTNIAEYEIHEPEQDAFGDWAAICIGGRYYLFGDSHPAGSDQLSVAWFTSPSIDEPFTWCGSIGTGHPDPDIAFAEGRFYLVTQQETDFISPGPWVETVEARVGVDTDQDGDIDQWTSWSVLKERYEYIPGFSKQIARKPARLDLTGLPDGTGFQIQLRLTDSTANPSKPVLERMVLSFD